MKEILYEVSHSAIQTAAAHLHKVGLKGAPTFENCHLYGKKWG
jgi:hypothetical protein